MKKFFKLTFGVLLIFGVIQFIPVDRTNKAVNPKDNFVQVLNSPKDVTEILKNACYDCHSNETIYPNYAYIAPISWSIKNHINSGREHLNFSIWNTYNQDQKKGILEHAISEIEEKNMPIKGYINYHPKANLNNSQRKTLVDYFQSVLDGKTY